MIMGDYCDIVEVIVVCFGIINVGEDDVVIIGVELDVMSDVEFGKKVGDYLVYVWVVFEYKV